MEKGLAINGVGAVVTAVMTVVIAATKFSSGAWIILITIPVMLLGLLKVNRHYEEVDAALSDPARRGPVRDLPRQRVVIPVRTPGPEDMYAAAYAKRVLPLEVRIVHFAPTGTDIAFMWDAWGKLGEMLELRLRTRSIPKEIRNLAREIRADADEDALINVIIPESVQHTGWRHVLHTLLIQRIKAALVAEANVVVTSVAHHAGYEELEPVSQDEDVRHAMDGWRHVAVVLAAGAHNATDRSLRYAMSLRADELRCLHVQVDEKESKEVQTRWRERYPDMPLEVLDSPYRQVGEPIHAWVRDLLDEHPKTFVTLVIPEFVVRRWWHRLLHNHTALTLKGTFLFEPSVVVSAVPYRL